MAKETSFIHTSDLHLNGEKNRFQILSKIVFLCIKKKVAALVIAGDLFDNQASKSTINKAYLEFNRLKEAQIKVFLIKGDEDAHIKLTNLPSNVELLNNNASFSINGHRIELFHGRPEDINPRSKAIYMALGHFHDFTKINSRAYYSGSPVPSLKYKIKPRYIIFVKLDQKVVRPIRIKL